MKVYIVFECWTCGNNEVRAVFQSARDAENYIHNNTPDDRCEFYLDFEDWTVR